jgi:hypothetical protein
MPVGESYMNPISRVFLSMTLLVAFAMLAAAARPLFSDPILVKYSPTNRRAFDVSWNDNSELRLCAGPNGAVTDDPGHVWAGDGDANIIEADDKPGTTIKKNRLDVFDPHNLPNPVKSFPVECSGSLLGLTLSGLTVGPN